MDAWAVFAGNMCLSVAFLDLFGESSSSGDSIRLSLVGSETTLNFLLTGPMFIISGKGREGPDWCRGAFIGLQGDSIAFRSGRWALAQKLV